MATAIREQLAQALAVILAAIDGVTFRRAPATEFDEAELPALGLILGDQEITNAWLNAEENRLEVRIIGQAKGEDGEAAEIAAHALYAAAAAVLADPTLGGLAFDCRQTAVAAADLAEADKSILSGFELTVEITFFTAIGDPTSLSTI